MSDVPNDRADRPTDEATLFRRVVAGVTHDLSNPLTYMTINLELLEEQQRALTSLLAGHERIAEALGEGHPLVRDLEAARAALPYPPQSPDIEALVAETRAGAAHLSASLTALRRLVRGRAVNAEGCDAGEILEDWRRLVSTATRGRLRLDIAPPPNAPVLVQPGALLSALAAVALAIADATVPARGPTVLRARLSHAARRLVRLDLDWDADPDSPSPLAGLEAVIAELTHADAGVERLTPEGGHGIALGLPTVADGLPGAATGVDGHERG